MNAPDVAVGTGPYALKAFSRGSELVLTPSETDWAPPPCGTSQDPPNQQRRPACRGPAVGRCGHDRVAPVQDMKRIEEAGDPVVGALSNRVIQLAMDQDGDASIVERRKDHVLAATCPGLSHRRIMTRHLLPNCLPPLIVVMTAQIAHAIALEATLSFPGVGVPVPEPSLGLLIANGCNDLLSDQYISLFPGIVLVLTIVSLTSWATACAGSST